MARIWNKYKTNTPLKRKVLVFMSGGVDSSVAAALLARAGHEVTGVFTVDYDDPASPNCWRGDYQDAVRVAAKLGIKLLRWDFTKEYKKLVLDYMYREYAAGRTPNPDVRCNKFIKFGAWLKKAKKIGFDKIATGHYARSTTVIPSESAGRREIPVVKLLEAKDKNKDQTYFLHQLSQAQLQHVLFPLGNHTKPEVRKLAKKFGLSTADKAESMGICFVGEVPMKEFLQKKIKIKKGKVVTGDGQAVREHDGLAFYTIGQRIGIMSSGGPAAPASRVRNDHTQPLYVVDKSFKANELVVGHEDDPLLYKEEIRIGEINWIGGQTPQFPLKCKVRLRHRQELQNCVAQCHCEEAKGRRSNLSVRFTKSQRAVTPGQFAVFYLKGECLGGGVVKS